MEKSFFFNAVVTDGVPDRTYSAEDIAQREACLISNGVIGASSLIVLGGSGNALQITDGAAVIDGYTYLNTGSRVIYLEEGDTEYDRIDTVALKLDLGVRSIKAVILKGYPSDSPASSVPNPTDTVKYLPLAEVRVPAGSLPSISAEHITDKRIFAGLASAKEELMLLLREYLGEIDPIDSREAAKIRRVIGIVNDSGDSDTVLCGDGKYRTAPVVRREKAAEFTVPGEYVFELSNAPSEDDTYDIELQGAGGGGGSFDGTSRRGGGGGGGAYLYIKGVKLHRDRYTVNVGAGGAGGLGGDGADGGDTSFGGFVAEGGKGGKGKKASDGGFGGRGMFCGGLGGDGAPSEDGEIYPYCGKGGDSAYGDGAASVSGFVFAEGNNAEYCGAGGSGASSASGAFDKKGGQGGDGKVVIYRYIRPSVTEGAE